MHFFRIHELKKISNFGWISNFQHGLQFTGENRSKKNQKMKCVQDLIWWWWWWVRCLFVYILCVILCTYNNTCVWRKVLFFAHQYFIINHLNKFYAFAAFHTHTCHMYKCVVICVHLHVCVHTFLILLWIQVKHKYIIKKFPPYQKKISSILT